MRPADAAATPVGRTPEARPPPTKRAIVGVVVGAPLVILVDTDRGRASRTAAALRRAGALPVAALDAYDAAAAMGAADFRAVVVGGDVDRALLRGLAAVGRRRHPDLRLFAFVDRGVDVDALRADTVADLDVLDAGVDPDAAARRIRGALPDPSAAEDDAIPVGMSATDPALPLPRTTQETEPLLDGALAAGTGPAVLLVLYAQELTGVLRVVDGPARGALYVERGDAVWCEGDDDDDVGAAVRAGTLSGAAAYARMRDRIRARVLGVAEANAGRWTFREDDRFVAELPLVRVNPIGLVVEARRRRTPPHELMRLARELERRTVVAGAALEQASERLKRFTNGVGIARLLEERITVAQLFARTGLDPLMGTVVLLGLEDARLLALKDVPPPVEAVELRSVVTGAFRRPVLDAAEEQPDESDDVKAIRKEVADVYMRAKLGADARALLDVGVDADATTLRAAKDALLQRLDPTRLPAGLGGGALLSARIAEVRALVERAWEALAASVPALADEGPAVPALVGRFELGRRIGVGGMAEVFVGRQAGVGGFERRVVVKRIHPNLAHDAEFVHMFLEEARLAARVAHPNVVAVVDAGKAGEDYFLIMEYVPGRDLGFLVNAAKRRGVVVPTGVACRIVADLCAGLHAAHAYKTEDGRAVPIVHRDVSPGNVLVSMDGTVKLTDFGVAKASDSASRTRAGVVKGKLYYLSPERVAGEPGDARSDLFAVGIVLYVLLTQQHPFQRPNDHQTLRALRHAELPDPRPVRGDVPAALDRILLRALAKDPADRFQTARALGHEIELACVENGVRASTLDVGTWVRALVGEDEILPGGAGGLVPEGGWIELSSPY